MVPKMAILSAALAAALLWGAGAAPAQTLIEPAVPSPAAPAEPGPAAPPGPLPLAQPQRPLDLIVTVTMGTGQAETFAREIDRMEIVTAPDGRIVTVHLVLVGGGERNTHVWYNFPLVAKLSYRFVTAEGRAKVHVRVLQPSSPARELTERVEPLSPRDYR